MNYFNLNEIIELLFNVWIKEITITQKIHNNKAEQIKNKYATTNYTYTVHTHIGKTYLLSHKVLKPHTFGNGFSLRE